MRKARIIVTYYPLRGYRWQLKAVNGKTVAYGTRLFPDRRTCYKAVEKIARDMTTAEFIYVGHPNEL